MSILLYAITATESIAGVRHEPQAVWTNYRYPLMQKRMHSRNLHQIWHTAHSGNTALTLPSECARLGTVDSWVWSNLTNAPDDSRSTAFSRRTRYVYQDLLAEAFEETISEHMAAGVLALGKRTPTRLDSTPSTLGPEISVPSGRRTRVYHEHRTKTICVYISASSG
ncbi:hypothetical protein F5Y12DRAFT_714137 [Xylaria sp. FL1777]|nr:hypothetical protein F5Y12DRAFT_714137 [Xylaria sp. FL1777]